MSTKKKITRKEFISKTSKCIGGIVCIPVTSSVFQSCTKPELIGPDASENILYSECPCHFAQFNQEGNVITPPNSAPFEIEPLNRYNTIIEDSSIIITDDDQNELILLFEDYEELSAIGGSAYTNGNEIDSYGILLYRKSQNEVIALSRTCTHLGCRIDPFQSV